MNDNPHDETTCFCGIDPLEESEDGPLCLCPCAKCCSNRDQVLWLWRIRKLALRLEKSGIKVSDLVDLIWMNLHIDIEARIEKMVKEEMRRLMKDIRLVSGVQWSSIKD